MANYRLKPDPAALRVDAVRWFKDGDHPAVTPIFGAGKMIDVACGHPSNEHGFLKTPEGTVGVCPGDWIVTDARGQRWKYRPEAFDDLYEQRG